MIVTPVRRWFDRAIFPISVAAIVAQAVSGVLAFDRGLSPDAKFWLGLPIGVVAAMLAVHMSRTEHRPH